MVDYSTGKIGAAGGHHLMPDVVVAKDKKKRHIISVAQAAQIFGRQVAAGDDELNALPKVVLWIDKLMNDNI